MVGSRPYDSTVKLVTDVADADETVYLDPSSVLALAPVTSTTNGVMTPAMLASLSTLESETAGALDLADAPTSTSVHTDAVLGVQAGNVVAFGNEDIGPSGIGQSTGADRLRFRGGEDFYGFATVTTNDTMLVGTKWETGLSGTGAQVAPIEAVEIFISMNVHGAAELGTGTTTTGHTTIRLGAGAFVWNPSHTFRYGGCFRIPTLSDSTDQFEVQFGLVRVETGVTQTVAVQSSTATAVDTGVAIDTNYHVFTIEYLGDGVAHYYIDGVSVAIITTNLPANAQLLKLVAGIFKAAGTTSRSIRVDAISWDLPARRTKSLVGMP
jgi:hypothetical protein